MVPSIRDVCLMVVMLAIGVVLMFATASWGADLLSCVKSCLDGGGAVTPTPTPNPTPAPAKIFPHKITFERQSDEGYGAGAVILFGTLADGAITKVVVNGETAKRAAPYRGHPVFTLGKTGDLYSRPLRFVITGSDGQVYTATSDSATPAPTPDGNSETAKTSAWANGNREHFRLSKPGSAYGNGITLEFSNGLRRTVTTGANRQEWSDGTLWKPVSDSNGKAVVLGPRNVHIASVTVRY